jgi:integrase
VWFDSQALTNAARTGSDTPCKAILELYLADAEKRVSPKTFENYKAWYQRFCDTHRGLLIRELKPQHVQQWWATAHPKWGPSLRNLSGSALKAATAWAAAPGKGGAIIPADPLRGFTLPTMKKRSAGVVITQKEFEKVLGLIESGSVRDILQVCWITGTRPVNLSRVTRACINEAKNAFVLTADNTPPGSAVHKTFKATGRPLVIPLPDEARDIVLRLAVKHPKGPLFRTPTGLPWDAVKLATLIRHYAVKAGLQGRLSAYSLRHTRATQLLEAGMNLTDVAATLGNTPQVVARNYSHVAANVDRLLKLRQDAEGKTG